MKQTKQNKQTYCQAQSCFNCRSRQCCSFVEAWKMLKGKIVTLCGMSCWNRKVVATFHSFFHLTYITLLWAVQSQGQWRSISTGLSPDRQRGWPLHPLQRSGACGTIIEEREFGLSRQHSSRTGPSMWRECNHLSHGNLQQDLADRRMANPMDPVLIHHTSQERQPAAVPKLPNDQPH